MNDLKSDSYGKYNGNELEYVSRVLDSEDIENKKNPWVKRFEKAFTEKFNRKYAIAHNSGTSTLHTCLAAAGVGAWDEVISPAQTVIMNSFAILYQNAIPVYADIDRDTFNIDPIDIERKITKRTKAIIAVHMHGLSADMDPIMEIARKNNLFVIEDSAQCVLGKYKGRIAGSIGHMASYSFETKKHLSVGEGGMVITDDEDLAVKIRKIGGLGYKTLQAGESLRQLLPTEFQDPGYKRHDSLGWNYRMNEITAAVGLAQLERIDFIVSRRQQIASFFLEALDGCNWIIPQKVPEGYENSYWTFTVRYEGEKAYRVKWKEFYNLYKKNGGDGFYGGLSVVYQEPVMRNKVFLNGYLPKNEIYKKAFNYERGYCPVAEEIQPKMMQFKTNYRNLEVAKIKAQALKKTIKEIEG
ncbi:MAG: DegT/DnrJ/EryC1/StrS family aminotransferase [Thermoplasmatales archaeon]|nr:MAG: DegT/DnrJ/EryC1/StrS family aminotransferase [Thermoplasmatales archaeon]